MRRGLLALLVVLLSPAIVTATSLERARGSWTALWDANAPEQQITNYVLGYRTSPTGPETLISTGTSTSWTLPTADDRATYYVRVYAENAGGRGPASLEVVSPPTIVDPTPRPGPQGAPGVAQLAPTLRINFQPAGSATPPGYLADTGAVFGDRGNGYAYGWLTDNTLQARDRNAITDQLRDTFNQFNRPLNPDAVWELALPNGDYEIYAVAGDPSFFDSVFRLGFEGVVIVDGTPTDTARFVEGRNTVTVRDGRLTVRSAGGSNNKLCFVEITPR